MQRKPTLNLAIPEALLNEFNAVCRAYGHNKQKGQVLSAALMMFMEADPRDQGRWVEEVVKADVAQGIDQLLERVRRQQGLRVAQRDAAKTADSLAFEKDTAEAPPAKAAKKRRPAQKPVKRVKKKTRRPDTPG
ncbi:MAG: hypothetical protein AAGJ38_04730 [Planctomycetota bacterium]